jgi:hypothetical protein
MRFSFVLLVSLIACKASTQTSNVINIEKVATEKLGNDLEKKANSLGTFVLFSQQVNPQTPTRLVRAVVIETATGKIVAEEAFVPGHIKWITDTSLEVYNVPGMIRANQTQSDYTKTIQLTQLKQ